jgi:hypothetical protein
VEFERPVTIRLTHEQAIALDRLASEARTSWSQVIRDLIERAAADDQRARPPRTRKAPA